MCQINHSTFPYYDEKLLHNNYLRMILKTYHIKNLLSILSCFSQYFGPQSLGDIQNKEFDCSELFYM